ncbi:MAG: LytTR family DNA-binding domain-containing protein, partial [Bacteroidota bacterium]
VLLLDVNMPKLSGIGLLKSLDRPPLVIFTTAYPEFAVEGFELEAVDYLLKPFSLERFIKAINRAADRLAGAVPPSENRSGHLLVKADKKLYKVDFQDILHLEAYGDYVKIFTREKMLLTKERLAVLEESLPKQAFFRIHRSHVISLEAVEFIEGNMVSVGGLKLPVSEGLRETLVERLGRR